MIFVINYDKLDVLLVYSVIFHNCPRRRRHCILSYDLYCVLKIILTEITRGIRKIERNKKQKTATTSHGFGLFYFFKYNAFTHVLIRDCTYNFITRLWTRSNRDTQILNDTFVRATVRNALKQTHITKPITVLCFQTSMELM